MKQSVFPPLLALALLPVFLLLAAFPVGLRAQETLQGLTLREALERALDANPSLRAVEAQRAAAASRVWEARSGHLPQISANAGYSWYQEPNIVFPIHKAGVFPPLDDRIFESSVQATLPLFSGGKVVRRTDAARAGVQQADARASLARQDLLRRIAELYLHAAELDDRRGLLGERLADLRRRKADLDALAGEGRASQAQLALIDAQMAGVRADSLQAGQAAVELAWRLGQLTGVSAPVHPRLDGHAVPAPDHLSGRIDVDLPPVSDQSSTAAQSSTVGLRSVENNSEWRLAHAQKLQAEAEASFASRAFFPDLSGFAAYQYRSGGSAWDPSGEWVAGLRLSLPLLDGGRSIAALSMTEATLRAAEENLEAAAQRARADHAVARSAHAAALARLHGIEQAVEHRRIFVAAQRDLHAAGRLSLGELEIQETELLQLALQAKALKYEALRAIITIAYAEGALDRELLLTISGEDRR